MDFEDKKHEDSIKKFHANFKNVLEVKATKEELIHMFPIFTGELNLARFLALYELYKKTNGVLGHIAEVGIWKGASFFFFAKLIKIFEPNNSTQVHGFDWFKGMKMEHELDDKRYEGDHLADVDWVENLVKIQNLDNLAFVHNIDVAKDLESFFNENPSLQFKMVFLDCGIYPVLTEAIKFFWERLSKGGIIVFDHANMASVKAESIAIREFFGNDVALKTFDFTWWPSGYIIK